MTNRIDYDEFGMFAENIAEYGIPVVDVPPVRREVVEVAPGQRVSALVWGTEDPQVVFVHGTAMNAHTWDTVVLALGLPAVAIDLPGHGHSSWRDDAEYSPATLADDIAPAVTALAPKARLVVGMSLGGLTAAILAVRHPELVRRLLLVDITPGTNREKAKAVIDFVNGPQSFASFDDILARTIEHNPTRSERSLRRGILHNAHQLADGSWSWRYDRRGRAVSHDEDPTAAGRDDLWAVIERIECPVLLARGGSSPVVDDADVAELQRRSPGAEVVVVPDAGHSIQGDQPLILAEHIGRFIDV
ncbi:MAG: alpha/beta fold hydrolase [Acidimicrobiia bacterium]